MSNLFIKRFSIISRRKNKIIEAGGAFSGKLESIDGLKLNNRAEIHINKYYQGIITLYRVS